MPLTNYGTVAINKAGTKYLFPTQETPPASPSYELVASAPTGGYTTYTVEESGFYTVNVMAGGGQKAGGDRKDGGYGGCAAQTAYLYKGQKCLLWAGRASSTAVAYPGAQTSDFGGRGGSGFTTDESGGGGGGPAIAGSGPGYEGGYPGAGSGFLAGFDNRTFASQTITVGSLTRNINYAINTTAINFTAITVYVVAGGGGGGCANNGDHRSGGGGGGAMGNGGDSYWSSTGPTNGPAGTWGAGAAGSRYSTGASGAWAVIDFSRAQTNSGVGSGLIGADGYCRLYKVV